MVLPSVSSSAKVRFKTKSVGRTSCAIPDITEAKNGSPKKRHMSSGISAVMATGLRDAKFFAV